MKYEIPVHFNNGELENQSNIAKRIKAKKDKELLQLAKFMFISIVTILIMVGLWNTPKTNASYENAEYAYYGVDNYKDYSRTLRKETCYRA
jgi:hypothetical protein